MKLSNLMAVKSIVCFVFGIPMLLAPVPILIFFGITLDPGGSLIAQLLGAMVILLGTLLWLARNAAASDPALRAIVFAVVVGDTIGFVVLLLGQLAGVTNALGWINVAIWLFFAVSFAYFQFVRPVAQTKTSIS
ncbi:MAG: hypothetical protein EOM24_00520 [Chloroflexia bacterium]|nr:hypothetical protein [Chloroflexia bacterium]